MAEPLTEVVLDEAGFAVHAERWSPQGELLRGDSAHEARLSARLLARVVAALEDVHLLVEPDPPPYWLGWAYADADPWPVKPWLAAREASLVPLWVDETARRATARIRAADLPGVLGHGDWEAQNLRWSGTYPAVVHDWDSLARLPEAALVGAACGAFASAEVPTLAPLASSRAFLDAYQEVRGRRLSGEEEEVAWAASLWPAAHNARAEALFGAAPTAGRPLADQHVERLRLAGA